MIAEAEKNCAEKKLTNVVFHQELTAVAHSECDLVHSFIVLQHIPPKEGLRLMREMIDRIKPEGVGVLHLTFNNGFSWLKRLGLVLRRESAFFHRVCNLLQGRRWNMPLMAMYTYDLSLVLALFHEKHICELHTTLVEHGAFRGVCFFFRLPS